MPDIFFENRGNLVAAGLSKHAASPNVWADCPWVNIREGNVGGVAYFNDYDKMPLIGTQTTQIGYGDGKVFATSGSSVVPVLTVNSVAVDKGVLAFTSDASTHSASYGDAYGSLRLSGSSATAGKLWFEARVATSTSGIVTNRLGWMVGLAEVDLWTLATGVPFSSNAGAITNSAAFLGFEHLPADTTQIRTAYSDRATAFTEIGTAQGTLAANTFTNLAFTYDPNETDATKKIRFYQDNLELGTGLTQTLLAGFTNLNANALGLIIAAVGGSSASSDSLYVQWVRMAQLSSTP